MPAVRARDVTGRVMHAREHLALALAQAAGHGSNAAAVGGRRTPEQLERVSVSRRAPRALAAASMWNLCSAGIWAQQQATSMPGWMDPWFSYAPAAGRSRGGKRNIPGQENKTRPGFALFALAFKETAGQNAGYAYVDDVADCRFRF